MEELEELERILKADNKYLNSVNHKDALKIMAKWEEEIEFKKMSGGYIMEEERVESWVDDLISGKKDINQKSLKDNYEEETEQDKWLKGLKYER